LPWFSKFTSKQKGDFTEDLAADYLSQQGLYLVTKNFSSSRGEIDLIMKDQDTLVFVEVKYRKSRSHGGAISTISVKKQHKLKLCAAFYFQQSQLNEYNTACRFDVVTLEGDLIHPEITWLKNAF